VVVVAVAAAVAVAALNGRGAAWHFSAEVGGFKGGGMEFGLGDVCRTRIDLPFFDFSDVCMPRPIVSMI